MQMADAVPDVAGLDLFREVHKGLRNEIFRVTVAAGATDGDDDGAVEQLVTDVTELVELLQAHAGHEDRHIEPLLERHAPAVAADLAVAHGDSEAALEELLATATALREAAGDRSALLDTLYDHLADFTVSYVAHLRDEEGIAMPALASALTVDELQAVQIAIRSQIPPQEMCRFMKVMIPAMNAEERVAMLSGMQAAPPDIFDLFQQTARSVLPAADWSKVAARLA